MMIYNSNSSQAGLSHLLLTVWAQMLHVVAPFDAERNAAEWIAAEKAASYAHTPLITSAFMLKSRS